MGGGVGNDEVESVGIFQEFGRFFRFVSWKCSEKLFKVSFLSFACLLVTKARQSGFFEKNLDVPQGIVLGPKPFTVRVNDVLDFNKVRYVYLITSTILPCYLVHTLYGRTSIF